ncbi:TetR/AcrR family transcriptional regulator [Sphingomonas sp.]|uniref:TetR/AcrR family transcriptional regulator n=1 Tax=Sphingomonas sp. TaxID=28214 RepID=UPI001EB20415|nr:TetR/AcrR family transcriptional regulator [Sphingomonas sp.]MBX3593410.1 TetR/AcrR family transcriptional regulator [Sphingomonas sp.]
MTDKGAAIVAPATGAKTRRGQAMRDILLSSAIKLTALHGYGATTTQAILDDAGVSRGSLLHQFPTRDLLMVATAHEAMNRMLVAVEAGITRHGDLLKGLLDFPNILWRVQTDLPARAFTEIQLASRWDPVLEDGLKGAMATVNALTTSKVVSVAEQFEISNLPRLLHEIYLLISATQGLAIGRDLIEEKAMTAGALAILKDRFVAALKASLA